MLKKCWFGIYVVLLPSLAWSNDFSIIQDNIKPGNIVIIGENHQKPESTQLFAQLIDTALERHQCLTVGLEINQNQQPIIDAVTKGEATLGKILHVR